MKELYNVKPVHSLYETEAISNLIIPIKVIKETKRTVTLPFKGYNKPMKVTKRIAGRSFYETYEQAVERLKSDVDYWLGLHKGLAVKLVKNIECLEALKDEIEHS